MKSFVKYSALGALSLGLVGFAVTAAAVADNRHDERAGPARFEKLDTNADGFVTPDEMAAPRLARFNTQDTNDDGFLTLDELQAAAQARIEDRPGGRGPAPDAAELADRTARMLRYFDENGDGKVAFDEMPDYRGNRMFTMLDTNADGQISKAEFDVAAMGMRMGHKGRFGHDDDRDHRRPRHD